MPRLTDMTAEEADELLCARVGHILKTKLAVERSAGGRHWSDKRTRNQSLVDQVDEALDDGDAMLALMRLAQIVVRTQLVDPGDR